jgi:hypothetical protein
VKRGRTSLHIARGWLPLADNTVALTVDHVVNIDAGEETCHVRYHILSLFVFEQYTTSVGKMQGGIFAGKGGSVPKYLPFPPKLP